MFDIGFFELVLVAIVGLLVIGPQRLPEILRQFMLWRGRIGTYLAQIKNDINEHIGVDDIRQQLHNEAIMRELEQNQHLAKDLQNDIQGLMDDIQANNTLTPPPPTQDNKIDER